MSLQGYEQRWGVGGLRAVRVAAVLAACMMLSAVCLGQQVPAAPALVMQSATSVPVDPNDANDSLLNADLPLRFQAPEELQALSSTANDAAPAERGVVDAGEADTGDGAGAPRGAATDGAAASGLSYGGFATIENETTLDGLSAQQSFRAGPRGSAAGGARGGSSYALGALLSLRTMTLNGGVQMFSAEYGGAGGVTRAETRTGTRKLHGSAEWISEESALAATNPYSLAASYSNGVATTALVKPAGAMNQLSIAAGVPLAWSALPARLRKSATLFGALDSQLREDKIVSSPEDSQFFSLTPEQMALLGNRGVSAAATASALDYLGSLTGTTSRSAYRLTGMLRADADVSARDHVTVAFNGNRVDAVAGAALGQASDAVVARGTGSLGDSYVGVEAGSAHWVHRFSAKLENEVRGQVAHDLEHEQPRAPDAQEPAIGPGGLAPEVSIGPLGFAYGTPASLGRTAYPDEMRDELADTLRWHVGKHLLTLGGDWSRVHDRIANIAAQEGAFLYDSGTTDGHDGGLVDWITDYTFNANTYPNGGCPSIVATIHDFCFRSYTQGFGAQETQFVTHEFAGYAQDAMQFGGLRVTLGARYDYTLLPLPQNPNAVLDSDLAAVGVVAQTSRFPEDRNNVGPRVAAAWSPLAGHSRLPKGIKAMTVQVGYGVFFGRVPGGTIRAALADTAMPASYEHIRITPTTITQCPQVTTINQGFGYPCAFDSTPPAAVQQTTSATLFARNFRVPMVQRATFTLETNVTPRVHVRANYALAYAKQLPVTTDVNIASSRGEVEYVLQGGDAPGEHWPGLHTGEMFAVPLYAQRKVLQYGVVTEVESNANAYYNSATVEGTWRGEGGLYVRGSYTFSRVLDDGPLQTATPTLDSQFDPFDNGYDKGLSSLQFPQRFAGELQYESHWRRGSTRERRALNGWRVSAIATAGSGAPYSYMVFGGQQLTGGHESINGSGGATYLPTLGRNTLHLPPRGKVDLRLGREFAHGQRVRLNVFAEAFNLLNERNLSSLETRAFLLGSNATIGGVPTGPTPLVFQDAAEIATEGIATEPFGTPTSSTTGMSRERRVQFGLRLQF